MTILGISYLGSRNTSACIIKDGKLVAFSEEERFNRIKHSPNIFPTNAIQYCFDIAGVNSNDIDYVAVGHLDLQAHSELWTDDEFRSMGEIGYYGNSLATFYSMINSWAKNDKITQDIISNNYNINPSSQLKWYPHHDCHAISAIIPSKFKETNYITADGAGDNNAGIYGYFDGEHMNHFGYIHLNRSLGGFYAAASEILGFRRNSEEGKTMGLASYGEVDNTLFPEEFIENKFGMLEIDALKYISYFEELNNSERFKNAKNDILSTDMVNFAATVQNRYETSVLSFAKKLNELTSNKNYCLAGGSFLNCTGNGKILEQDYVDNIFIQPASNDSGTALGAAILCYKEMTGEWPEVDFNTAYWGREFSDAEILDTIEKNGLNYVEVNPSEELARLINENYVVGYFNGRSEVGPRALCHRSILANPTFKENLDRVNIIKNREFWRPLAPVMLEEDYYDIVDAKQLSPFMLIACEVKDEWRDKIPATTHIDNSCRPQSINSTQNETIHSALVKFKEMSGVPVFMNTSFNVAGEPLVDSPQDAINTFFNSGIDVLMLGKYCIFK